MFYKGVPLSLLSPKLEIHFYSKHVVITKEVTEVSIGPRRDNKLVLVCALPVWTFGIHCMLVLSANEQKWSKRTKLLLYPVGTRSWYS